MQGEEFERVEFTPSDTEVHLFTLDLTIEQRWTIQDVLIQQIGKPYDHAGILGFLAAARTENPARWFCSELILAAYKRAGTDLLKRVSAWNVSPGLLACSQLLQLHNS